MSDDIAGGDLGLSDELACEICGESPIHLNHTYASAPNKGHGFVSKPVTIHCHNWKVTNLVTEKGVKTVCQLRRPPSAIASLPRDITCSVCALRVVREGQSRGLVVEQIDTWTWRALGATDPNTIQGR